MSNAVTNMINRIGMECHLPVATATTANGISANLGQASDNIQKLGMLTDQIKQQQDNSSPAEAPKAGGGASFMRSALTAGAFAVGAALAPALAPALAVGGAVAATMDVGKFVGHAATHGAQGEMTLASSLATFSKSGEITSYKPACEEYEPKPAKSLARVALGQAPAPATGMHNMKEIIADEMGKADIGDIQASVRKRTQDNMDVIDRTLYAADKKGMMNSNDPNALAMRENMGDVANRIDSIAVSVPKPLKALNVGMGAPGMG